MGNTHAPLLVPAGELLMGWGEQQRAVHLDPFSIDRHQTTNAHCLTFVGRTAGSDPSQGSG